MRNLLVTCRCLLGELAAEAVEPEAEYERDGSPLAQLIDRDHLRDLTQVLERAEEIARAIHPPLETEFRHLPRPALAHRKWRSELPAQ